MAQQYCILNALSTLRINHFSDADKSLISHAYTQMLREQEKLQTASDKDVNWLAVAYIKTCNQYYQTLIDIITRNISIADFGS